MTSQNVNAGHHEPIHERESSRNVFECETYNSLVYLVNFVKINYHHTISRSSKWNTHVYRHSEQSPEGDAERCE